MHRRFEHRSWIVTISVVGLLGLLWGGCSNRTNMPTAPALRTAGPMASQADPPRERNQEDKPKTTVDYCVPFTPFANARFSHPLNIDNKWSPMAPGTQYVLTGQADRGLGVKPHDVIFTVTDVVKTINGIDCVVLWDRDFQEDPNNPGSFILAEVELAFFAQDDNGNIWMMGEYPEEFDITSGEFQGAPNTWIPGIDGTEAGTLMLGNPKNGTSGYYLQARAPSIRFLDCAKVWKMGETQTVSVGTFTNVLVTDERAPADWRGGHQQKFYAPGVGNIRVDFVGDPEGEVLEMTSRKTLSATELAAARAEVLRLDDRGFQFNDVYLQTARAR
jgi:hypothetical protein